MVLAQEEANELETPVMEEDEDRQDTAVDAVWAPIKHVVGPSQMIFRGLEIENHQ